MKKCWVGENRTHMRPINLSTEYQSEGIQPNINKFFLYKSMTL